MGRAASCAEGGAVNSTSRRHGAKYRWDALSGAGFEHIRDIIPRALALLLRAEAAQAANDDRVQKHLPREKSFPERQKRRAG
jgi:hypothetical protein